MARRDWEVEGGYSKEDIPSKGLEVLKNLPVREEGPEEIHMLMGRMWQKGGFFHTE